MLKLQIVLDDTAAGGKTYNDLVAITKVGVLLTKTTAMQNEVALSYHRVRVLYFLAAAFTGNHICTCILECSNAP